MILRPVDASGDILPVRSSSGLLSGPEAVAQLIRFRLSLLQGEWWERPEYGFSILESLQSSRLTEAEASMLSSRITEYIRQTDGVLAVDDVRFSITGRTFSYSCTVRTKEGTAGVTYHADV